MRYIITFLLIISLASVSCKKKERDPGPENTLNRWSKSLETINYKEYSSCEAYPKTLPVFNEMYRDEYFSDLRIYKLTEPDQENPEKDADGNSYIRCTAQIGGTVIKRNTREPFQNIIGSIDFIKFTDIEKSRSGWLLSNRIITRTKK